jgi:hypothetical protein
MKYLFLILSAFVFNLMLNAQQLNLFAGANWGGAIPSETVQNSSGSGGTGVLFGIAYPIKLNEKLILKPSLSYELRRFSYASNERKDTVVSVSINNSSANVPTYYTAFVNGQFSSHYVLFSIPLSWFILKRYTVDAGLYYAYAFAGRDISDIRVQIGEGGVIDDLISQENNWDQVNKYEVGLSLGGSYYVNNQLSVSFATIRSFTPFYKEGYMLKRIGNDVKFFPTYVKLFLSYKF